MSEESEPLIDKARRFLRGVEDPFAPEPTLEEMLRQRQKAELLPERKEET